MIVIDETVKTERFLKRGMFLQRHGDSDVYYTVCYPGRFDEGGLFLICLNDGNRWSDEPYFIGEEIPDGFIPMNVQKITIS